MTELLVCESIEIQASAERVWQVLTDPELTPKYMFGCRAASDWKVGSPLLWELMHEGKKLVCVSGTILDFNPPTLLRYTVFDPNGTYADVPRNYLLATFAITPQANGVRLDSIMGDYATVDGGQKRYDDTVKGGDGLLAKIKALAEASQH